MKRVPNISCKCFMLVQFYGGISPPPQPLFWVRHAIHIPLSRYICKISTLFLHLRTPLALIKIQALARPEPSQVIRPSSVVSGVGNRQSSLPLPVVSAMPWAVYNNNNFIPLFTSYNQFMYNVKNMAQPPDEPAGVAKNGGQFAISRETDKAASC